MRDFEGQTVTLSFSVDCGPRGNCEEDRAGWADLKFDAGQNIDPDQSQSTFTPPDSAPPLVYNGEIQIYELPHSLSRASLFSGVSVANSPEQALQLLRRDRLDVLSTVVLEASELSAAVKALAKAQSPHQAMPQKIISYSPLGVEIAVKTDRAGLLMLNDTDYPGWKVYVDGQSKPILHADYLFRGVFVDAGMHKVVFAYEPDSFKFGLILCFLALVSVAICGLSGFLPRRH